MWMLCIGSEYENTGAREPKLPYSENGSRKIKRREPLGFLTF